jgi:DNA polymerase-3 subunit gamma/tau
MRDAQSLLEQVLSFSNGEVTEHDALAQLGIVPLSSFMRVMRGVASGSAKDIVDELNAVAASGADMQRYAAYLADGIRALRLIRNGVDIRVAAGFSSEEIAELTAISEIFHDEELSRFYERSASLQSEIRFIQNDLACVEMACLDFMAIKKSPSLAALLAKLGEVKTALPSAQQSNIKERVAQSDLPRGNMPSQETANQDDKAAPAGNNTGNGSEEINDTAPVPDDADISSKADLSEYDTDHPMVEKIKEIFHGEEVKRGE